LSTKNVRIVGTTGLDHRGHAPYPRRDGAGRARHGRSLAAVGGLNAFRDGLQAVKDGTFPAKR
jgi:hypothetical protein